VEPRRGGNQGPSQGVASEPYLEGVARREDDNSLGSIPDLLTPDRRSNSDSASSGDEFEGLTEVARLLSQHVTNMREGRELGEAQEERVMQAESPTSRQGVQESPTFGHDSLGVLRLEQRQEESRSRRQIRAAVQKPCG
jgi:hypothetical protein